MRAEHLAPAAVAAIACAFLALGLMLQRQMARQEQVLREILRMHQELLESIRLLERRQSLTGSQAPAGSAAGIRVDSDADPWYRDTGATLASARTGSRVPRAAARYKPMQRELLLPEQALALLESNHRSNAAADGYASQIGQTTTIGKGDKVERVGSSESFTRAGSGSSFTRAGSSGSVHTFGRTSSSSAGQVSKAVLRAAPFPDNCANCRVEHRSRSVPNELAQAGPRQIVATSSQTVRFSRCTSGPAGSRDLAPAAPRLASQPQTLSQEPPRLGSAAPRRVGVPTGSRDLAHVAAAGFSRCPSGSSHSVVSQRQHQLSQSAQPRRPRSSTSSGISFCKPAAPPPPLPH
jgi:hypothetical protein